MMQAGTIGMLRREFASRTQAEAFRFFQNQQREERARKDRKEDADNNTSDLIDAAVAMASVDSIRSLQADIDTYDTATIEALQENERQMMELREELDEMLAQAHVLPDGRRVFKTEDGKQVFDEHGNELDLTVIDPDAIEDWRPHWEVFDAASDEFQRLEQERSDLLEYQDKLDAARERLDGGDLTQAEYDRLQQDLVNEMPDTVRQQFPELADMEPEVEPQAASADDELDIADEHVPTATGPQAPAPGA